MNYIDVIICIPIAWGLFRGFTKGLVVIIATLAGLLLGIYAAGKLSGPMVEKLHDWNINLPLLAGFVLLLFIVWILVYFIGKLTERLVESASLGIVNKLSGAALGGLKFALLLSLIFIVLNRFESTVELIPKDVKEESLFYTPVQKIAPAIYESSLFKTGMDLAANPKK